MCVIYINVLGFGHIYRNLLHSHFYFHDMTLHQTISRYRSPVQSGWRLMKYRGLRTLIQGARVRSKAYRRLDTPQMRHLPVGD
jgi:hypothetical protein